MITFYNLALKIETSWPKKVAKPIIVYVWFIQSLKNNFKNMQCKKG